MRAFIVLCLVAVTSADKLGYNYQPVGHSASGLSFTPGSGLGGSLGGPTLGSGVGGGLNSGSLGSGIGGDIGDYGSSLNLAPSLAAQGDYSAATNDAPSYAPQAEFDKEFFSFTANEDDFHDPAASNQFANSIKQGLRVVFIKGPENRGLEDAALALARHSAEQKTEIYVLQKQTDLGSLANKLNTINKNTNNKPEVHFVKYRTPEDAANAQKAIQGQYDSLGGSSKSHDGGVAPVLNFASKAPAPVASYNSAASAPTASYSSESSAPSSSYIPPVPAAEEPSNTYLPATILRLFRL